MIVSHTHRFIYFSMPKTGSSAVRAMLEPYRELTTVHFLETSDEQPHYPHMRPAELAAVWDDTFEPFDAYYKFTVVRNPWARLVSLYNHLLSTRRFRWERRLGTVGRSFETWVEQTRPSGDGAGTKGNRYRRYGSFSVPAFCGDADGDGEPSEHLLVDGFLQLERIDADLVELEQRLGIPLPQLEQVNTRPHAPYREFYTERTRDLVAERYRWEIERFDYEF